MNPQVRKYLSTIGRKGGQVAGPQKKRTREQAQKAVQIRWAKYRAAKAAEKAQQ